MPHGRSVWESVPRAAMSSLLRPDGYRAWKERRAAGPEVSDRRWNNLATAAAAAAVRALQPTSRRRGDRPNGGQWTLDPELGLLDATDLAVVLFAANVAVHSERIKDADVDALRAIGLTNEQIFEIAVAAAASGYFAEAEGATEQSGNAADAEQRPVEASEDSADESHR